MKKLVVGNIEQKVILFGEMEGQISDGMWENSRPNDHWEVWMLKWDEIEVGPEPGRNFDAHKCNYNFADRELLDVVGPRLLNLVRLARLFPGVVLPIIESDHWIIPESVADYNYKASRADRADAGDGWWVSNYAVIVAAGITRDMMVAAETDTTYTMTDLRRDCKALSTACKKDLRESVAELKDTNVKYPKIKVKLVGSDGNAFAILGKVKNALRKGGVSSEEVSKFITEATSGNYDHLLTTCMAWVEVE